MRRNRLKRMVRASLAALALCATASTAMAADADAKRLRGFVDGKPFLDLYDEDCGSLVEVSLPPSVLNLVAAFIPEGEGEEAGDIAAGLDWIGAVIVGLCEESEADLQRGRELIDATRRRLESKGWATLTRIREQGSTVDVMILNDEKQVAGLVVLIRDKSEIVFANVAGLIDLQKLRALGEHLDLDALAQIPEQDQ